MLGALAGDIIGSVHEFIEQKTVDFPLFVEDSRFTDDSVLTIAVADCLLTGSSYVDAFHTYGVLWSTSGLLTAYLDGAPVAAARADSTKPMYVIINLGCLAGHSPASGSQLLVDWVRAWTP